ncbi:hypothetical protein VZT92_018670 [Zoarces viviparus]|uniref:Secreted protein n=1 Tax=Zoarces viviparus TaxID=48416 RepID=A0AAW1EIK2_ZOAVI
MCLHILWVFVVFYSIFTIRIIQKNLCISPSCKHSEAGGQRGMVDDGSQDAAVAFDRQTRGELGTLCRLSGDVRSRPAPATLPAASRRRSKAT